MSNNKIVAENEVTWLMNPDVEFVSLVGRAANQTGFKILKSQEGVSNMPNKAIYKVLVPKKTSTKKLNEFAEEHGFSVDKEMKATSELEGFNTFKQMEDEKLDFEQEQNVIALDKENGIYGIVATLQEEDEEAGLDEEKAVDWETADKVFDALMGMTDMVAGALRQPGASDASQRQSVMTAVDNFRKYAEAVLANNKSEEAVDLSEFDVNKYENIKDLFASEGPASEEDTSEEDPEKEEKSLEETKKALDELANSIDEKIQAKHQEMEDRFENMKNEINENLTKEMDEKASKEDVEQKFEEMDERVKSLENTPKTRKSESPEDTDKDKETKKEQPKTIKSSRNYVTFA